MLARRLRRILSILVCSICAAGLVACGGGSGPTTTIVLELDAADAEIQRQAVEIIGKRLEASGAGEYAVLPEGPDRIVVTLAGDGGTKRVVDLATRSATLEFRFVRSPEHWRDVLDEMDAVLQGSGTAGAIDSDEAVPPFTGLLSPAGSRGLSWGLAALVADDHLAAVRRLLADSRVRNGLDGGELWLSREPVAGHGPEPMHALYVLEAKPVITGRDVADAASRPAIDLPGRWDVEVQLTPRGGQIFAQVTAQNVGRHLAICLDREVVSAPLVQGPIPDGSAVISSDFTVEEATDLALSLAAGSLPTTVRLVEVRSR